MAPTRRLLAELVGRLGSAPEPTATTALGFVLQHPVASSALIADLSTVAPGLPQDVQWFAEHGGDGDGRPDLSAVSGVGALRRTHVVVEAKFDARFQPDQVPSYLRRLTPGGIGVLLLLAPDHRLPSLWSEAWTQMKASAEQRGEAPVDAPPPTATLRALHHENTPSGHVIAATSWIRLVALLSEHLTSAGERGLLSDVEQLASLISIWDANSFMPFLDTDFDVRSARTWEQTKNLLVALRSDLHNANDEAERCAVVGHLVYTHDQLESVHRSPLAEKEFRIVRGTELWRELGTGPLWLQVRTSNRMPRSELVKTLARFNGPGGPGVSTGADRTQIPLPILRNATRHDVVTDLARQVRAVAAALDAELASPL